MSQVASHYIVLFYEHFSLYVGTANSGIGFGFCELCKVALTSQSNANDHYNGMIYYLIMLLRD